MEKIREIHVEEISIQIQLYEDFVFKITKRIGWIDLGNKIENEALTEILVDMMAILIRAKVYDRMINKKAEKENDE